MLNENLSAKGIVSFVLTDNEGNIKQQQECNLVVNTGIAYIASRIKDATTTVVSHLAVGTGTTTPAATQTALVTELVRVALGSTSQITTTITNDSIQYVATFNPGVATGAITEAGLFNAASAGTMIARTSFPVINKGALDTLAITWKIVITP